MKKSALGLALAGLILAAGCATAPKAPALAAVPAAVGRGRVPPDGLLFPAWPPFWWPPVC